MITIEHVLVATDFSEVSEAALLYGQALGEQFGATLHLVHVVDNIATRAITADGFLAIVPDLQRELEESARQRLDAVLSGLRMRGPKPEGHIVTSSAAADAIVTFARESRIDLIVLGTHGLGGMSRLLLGSVAERVVRTAHCPVLTVHRREPEPRPSEVPPARATT